MSTIIISCECLKDYMAAAQKAAGNAYPVIWLNQKYHEVLPRVDDCISLLLHTSVIICSFW